MVTCALFLDFDGLICDTERAARCSWDEFYREFGLAFPACLWQRMAGRSDGESVAAADLSEQLGAPVTDVLLARRRRRKQALCETEPLRPGVATLIAAATRNGLTLAVVSSSPLAWVRGHLARLGVQDRFSLIVSGDDVARGKPAPDLYQMALQRTRLTANKAIAFEDSPTGVRAAKAARLRCVAVPNAAGSAYGLRHADVVLGSLESYALEADLLLMEGMPA
jgi:HAD superfamily hydrolase (TIGR01509 family)